MEKYIRNKLNELNAKKNLSLYDLGQIDLLNDIFDIMLLKVKNKDNKMTKIKEITEDYILFDNDKKITYEHDADCCEKNYADFKQLLDTDIMNTIFNENILFEGSDYGFRFGDENRKYFVPCYSSQNGYHSIDLDILYDGVLITNIDCKMED